MQMKESNEKRKVKKIENQTKIDGLISDDVYVMMV